MASWFTDFSEYTTGVAPSDWTIRWLLTDQTFAIREKTGTTGGKVLEHTSTVSARRGITWDDPGIMTDCIATASIRTSDKNTFQNGVGIRMSGVAQWAENAYYIQFASRAVFGYDFVVYKYVNGSAVQLGNTADLDWAVDTFYTLKIQAFGSAIKAKYWLTGDAEPATWQFEYTDTALTSGAPGLLCNTLTGTRDFDTFNVADTTGETQVLNGVISTTSITLANLNLIKETKASIVGSSTTLADLNKNVSMSASTVGSSTTLASLNPISSIRASVEGSSTTLASLNPISSIKASVLGASIVLASLNPISSIKASIVGSSTTLADLKILKTYLAQVNAQTNILADLTILIADISLVGEILGASVLNANLVPTEINLEAQVLGTSIIDATLITSLSIISSIVGSSTTLADLKNIVGMSASIVESSTVLASLNPISSIKASIVGSSTTLANLNLIKETKASTVGSSTVLASLNPISSIKASVVGSSTTLADLKILKNCLAEINAQSIINSTFINKSNMYALVSSVSEVTTNIIKITSFSATINSVSKIIGSISLPPTKIFLAEIAEYLDFKSIGVFDETGTIGDIYILTMPSMPNNVITLYARGGVAGDGKLGYDPLSIQILVRGEKIKETHQRAQDIYNTLHGFGSGRFTLNGRWVVSSIADQAGPTYISRDENKRFEFSLNFTMEIKNFEGSRNNGCSIPSVVNIGNSLEIDKIFISEIANYLMYKGVGIYDYEGLLGDIFIFTMPSNPNNVICLYQKNGGTVDIKLGYDPLTLEILVRGVNSIDTFKRAQDIYNILHGFHDNSFIVDGTWVINCLATPPNFITKDENKRFEYSITLNLEIKNFEGGRNNGGS